MKAMCKQGYNDALHFLKRNGKKKWFHVSIMLCSVVWKKKISALSASLIDILSKHIGIYSLWFVICLLISFFLMLSHLRLLSGLLNFNGPHRDRPLLANGGESEDYNDAEEDNKSDEEGAVMIHCSSSIEEHFIEHLPPTLHKGNF